MNSPTKYRYFSDLDHTRMRIPKSSYLALLSALIYRAIKRAFIVADSWNFEYVQLKSIRLHGSVWEWVKDERASDQTTARALNLHALSWLLSAIRTRATSFGTARGALATIQTMSPSLNCCKIGCDLGPLLTFSGQVGRVRLILAKHNILFGHRESM